MQRKLPYIVRNISAILVWILLIKIAGYFSIVEDRTINQIFKTISRMGMTGAILLVYSRLKSLGCVAVWRYEHVLSIFLYCVYLFLGLASFAWSSDPRYSALQWLMTFESFVFVFVFMKVVNLVNYHFPDYKIELEKLFAWAIFPIMLVFAIGSFVEPDTFYRGMRGGEEKRLGGWIMNPNELGMLSSLGAAMAYLFFQKADRKFWPLLMMVVAVVILVLTSSRSSAIGFLMIMGLLILASKNMKLKIGMFGGIALAIPLLLKYVVFKEAGGVEEVMSMTGRLPFWKALLKEGIIREPFFGFGFMRINYTDYFQGLNTYPARMTHNTFMQVLMNLGFVGFFIAFWQLVLTIRSSVVERKSDYNWFSLAMFVPIVINSFTEFGIFGESNYGILFYQFLILLFFSRIRENLSRKELVKRKLFEAKWGAISTDH